MTDQSASVCVASTFRDVGGKPFNADRAAIRLLNRKIGTGDHDLVILPISCLHATQPTVNADFRGAPARFAPGENISHPAVVRYQGRHYVTDGHHRVMAEAAKGAITIKIRLYDLDGSLETEVPLLQFTFAM